MRGGSNFMANRKRKMSLLTSAATKRKNARPHPGPLPQGEGETVAANERISHAKLKPASRRKNQLPGNGNGIHRVSENAAILPPLLGERAGVRADNPTNLISPVS